jgi:hypothetical protein
MRVLLWSWIVGVTALVLFMPPMHEKLPTRRGEATQWMSKGAFEQSVLGSSDRQIRVDISRLIITLLALNFLPAMALWRYNPLLEWLQRYQREIRALSVAVLAVIALLALLGVGLAIYGQAQRASSGGANAAGPPGASARPASQASGGWVNAVGLTPIPVRRAIPVTKETSNSSRNGRAGAVAGE